MIKRTLEELNLLDDFLFNKMIESKAVGEQFTRELLRIMLHKEFRELKIVPQRTFNGTDTDLHGTRLDVYVEEQGSVENATVYDIEPELKNKKNLVEALPRRVRFYHAKIDAECLESGDDYLQLKNVCVIMISSFDPFGQDCMVYTIRNQCAEAPDMPYDDGATTLFFYTKGTKGNPPQDLRELLHYMEKTTKRNAVNPDLQRMHDMVTQVKSNKEVALSFMKAHETKQMLIQEGRDEVMEELEKERQRANTAEQRADTAEAEIRRLREELALLKKQQAQ